MGLDEIDVTLKLATLDEIDDVSNTTRFFRNCYFGCGSNHMYCDLVQPFFHPAFCQYYLGCVSNVLRIP